MSVENDLLPFGGDRKTQLQGVREGIIGNVYVFTVPLEDGSGTLLFQGQNAMLVSFLADQPEVVEPTDVVLLSKEFIAEQIDESKSELDSRVSRVSKALKLAGVRIFEDEREGGYSLASLDREDLRPDRSRYSEVREEEVFARRSSYNEPVIIVSQEQIDRRVLESYRDREAAPLLLAEIREIASSKEPLRRRRSQTRNGRPMRR